MQRAADNCDAWSASLGARHWAGCSCSGTRLWRAASGASAARPSRRVSTPTEESGPPAATAHPPTPRTRRDPQAAHSAAFATETDTRLARRLADEGEFSDFIPAECWATIDSLVRARVRASVRSFAPCRCHMSTGNVHPAIFGPAIRARARRACWEGSHKTPQPLITARVGFPPAASHAGQTLRQARRSSTCREGSRAEAARIVCCRVSL
jgi:hypothetical protein